MIDTKKIGERIATMRKECGMTGEKFAELLNVSPQAVSKWETGKNLPETGLLPEISKLLGVSIDSILVSQAYPVKSYLGGRYIDDIPPLRWGRSQDCTWAGAVKLLLDAIGVNASYSEVMGLSGACYYFSMTESWCPSAAMPQVAYDPAIALEKAFGIERCFFAHGDRDSKIMELISCGTPVMMLQPRVEMEWGVLCGYTGEGQFYGRSYFDYLKPDEKDVFTDNNYFLAESYPGADLGMMCFYRKQANSIPLIEALHTSLEAAQTLYSSKPMHGGNYMFGSTAYDILINGLRCDDAGFATITPYGTTGNGIILLSRLIDARRAAHAFWTEKSQCLPPGNAQKMQNAAELYAGVVAALETVLPNNIVNSTQNGIPFEAWSGETRAQIAEALTVCRQLEQQTADIIIDVLKHW